MTAVFRHYRPYEDTLKVSRFLERTYPEDDQNPNWLRPRWEWMVYYGHGGEEDDLAALGLWEVDGVIVAMVNFEDGPGQAFFHVDPDHVYLRAEMLRYAEAALRSDAAGVRRLTLFVNDFDAELEVLAAAAGYRKDFDTPEVTARLEFAQGLPDVTLPDGFRIIDRANHNDLHKINRVLWRGFDHEGPPPEAYVAGRADDERSPLFRKELVVMVEAPNGDLASYAGVWHVPANRVAYVEPVATDPDYRRRGLGKVAVVVAVRRAGLLGATRAIVISGQLFYQRIGFQPLHARYPWRKEW